MKKPESWFVVTTEHEPDGSPYRKIISHRTEIAEVRVVGDEGRRIAHKLAAVPEMERALRLTWNFIHDHDLTDDVELFEAVSFALSRLEGGG
jgi:hypothetical protein